MINPLLHDVATLFAKGHKVPIDVALQALSNAAKLNLPYLRMFDEVHRQIMDYKRKTRKGNHT